MRRFFIPFLLFFLPSIAAADCVSYNFAPNPGSGFAGFGRFENSCSYQVIIRFRYSDGQTGLAGPIKPGQTERGYHGEAREIEYTWCDFDISACSPPPIGDEQESVNPNGPFKEDLEAQARDLQAELDRMHVELEIICEEYRNGARPYKDCEQAAEPTTNLMMRIFTLSNEAIFAPSRSEHANAGERGFTRLSSIDDPQNSDVASANDDSSVSGVDGPAASCVSLGWESHDGYQARTVQNTCSRGIVVRVCRVVRVQRGDCQLQLFTNPLEHNFGQLMLDGSRPKWRTNWYQFEGAATNLRFYAKYIQ